MYLRDDILNEVLDSVFNKEAQNYGYYGYGDNLSRPRSFSSGLGMGAAGGLLAGGLGVGIPMLRRLSRARAKTYRISGAYRNLFRRNKMLGSLPPTATKVVSKSPRWLSLIRRFFSKR